MKKRRRWLRVTLWSAVGGLVLGGVLFVVNGLLLANGERPVAGSRVLAVDASPDATVKVMAWNLAKGFAHRGGMSFDSKAAVEQRLATIAAVVRQEQPDLLFLSELLTECTPCDVDQLAYLHEHTDLHHWVFGENYNFGLPFCRVVGGNAILSRFPLTPVGNPDLAGRRPFWATHNNRRVLLADARVGKRTVRLAAMHTDSFDLANNLAQTEQILALCDGREAMLAGDFNAEPKDASMRAVTGSGRFTGALDGGKTWPADRPRMRIDYVFAPKSWTLVEHRVLDERTSDHRPVVSVFRLPR